MKKIIVKSIRKMTGIIKKRAFTLAEVLVAASIVGVIIAFSLPSLLHDYRKNELPVKLKKAYTHIEQAIITSEIKNGSVNSWDYSLSASDFYARYIKNYMKLTQYYGGVTTNSLGMNVKYLNGNSASDNFTSSDSVKFTAGGDYLIAVSSSNNSYRTVYVDINSFKKPNKYGIDIFMFTIQPRYKFMPYGFGSAASSFGSSFDKSEIKGSNNAACNKSKKGYWCASLIMADDWKIEKEYPY